MWTGTLWPPVFSVWRRRCVRCCVRCAAGACAIALALTAQACSWNSSEELPTLPVLTSLQRLTLDGTPGVWMDSDDAGRLAVWIYDVTGEDGR